VRPSPVSFELMGAKKRAAPVSPVKVSPVGKKAKVETPEGIALQKMLAAFDQEVGTMLSPNVVAMVKSVADKCLLTAVETRVPLETEFAKVVGAALEAAMEGLGKAHQDAIDVVTAEEEKVQSLQNALDEANTLKEKADESLTLATEEDLKATDKKTDADLTLANHQEEEKQLQPKKQTMTLELEGLREVQEIARGPENPSKKDVLKVQKALREVEAPEALILGIGSAIGKQSPLDQHFVNEAAKMLYDKTTKLEGELEQYGETLLDYAKKTRTLEATVEQFGNELNARQNELSEAKTHQKECIAAVKDSEKQKKAGDKALEKAMKGRDDAAAAENVGKETNTQFMFLFERTDIVPVAVEAEEEVKAAEGAEAPDVSETVPEAALSPEAVVAPEAAMEVEPVA